MENILVLPAGTGKAVAYAARHLQRRGIALADHPTQEVTHLLLDVPTKTVPKKLLEQLPETVTILGGNLAIPGHPVLDLLKNEGYLARNAAITAHCALQVTAEHTERVLTGQKVLIIGWGRIGKCLAHVAAQMGCRVTIAARKDADRAMAEALGFKTADITALADPLDFDLIYNTVPAPLPSISCPGTKIELASSPGLTGDDVIPALGLPGRYAPESSGILIAETFLKEVMA